MLLCLNFETGFKIHLIDSLRQAFRNVILDNGVLSSWERLFCVVISLYTFSCLSGLAANSYQRNVMVLDVWNQCNKKCQSIGLLKSI